MLKFTVGDRIKIVANNTNHGFTVGDECVVVERNLNRVGALARKVGSGFEYWISDDDANLVQPLIREDTAYRDQFSRTGVMSVGESEIKANLRSAISAWCRLRVNQGKCSDGDCEWCPVNAAYEMVEEKGDDEYASGDD